MTKCADVRALTAATLLSQDDLAMICHVEPATVQKWRAARRGPRSISVA